MSREWTTMAASEAPASAERDASAHAANPAIELGLPDAQFRRIALDPSRSVVVEACAGSGKTWLLVARMVRALLGGASPRTLLAITFTRAAAEEMSGRLQAVLRELAIGSDAQVLRWLHDYAIPSTEHSVMIDRARDLYERVLSEDPPTITTFHGWFSGLLPCAPLGAPVPRNAGLLEDAQALREQALLRLYRKLIGPQADPALSQAYRDAVALLGDTQVEALLLAMLDRTTEWRLLRGDSDMPQPEDFVSAALADWTEALAAADALDHDPLPAWLSAAAMHADLQQIAQWWGQALRAKAAKALATQLQALTDWLIAHSGPAASLSKPALVDADALMDVFLTKTGTVRAAIQPDKLALDGQRDTYARLLERWLDQAKHVRAMSAERQAHRTSGAVLRLADALLQAYQEIRDAQNRIDFNDLEYFALGLSESAEFAPALHARLDARYTHILVDEFQDTNPVQWRVLRAWLSQYQESVGTADSLRAQAPRVFLVGDPKQSIYRFRRADARLFDVASSWLRDHFGARHLARNTTRRNPQAVVALANRVFGPPLDEASEPPQAIGPAVMHGYHDHDTLSTDAGDVWVLPPLSVDASAEDADDSAAALRRLEGQQIATALLQLQAAALERSPQAGWHWSEVYLLVRARTHLAAYEAALRAAGIPYVSDRRGGLLDTLEASDLCQLLRALARGDDTLALAQVLRSPIGAWSDQDLLQWADWRRRLAEPADGAGQSPSAAAGRIGQSQTIDSLDHPDSTGTIDRFNSSDPQAWQALRLLAADPASSEAVRSFVGKLIRWREAAVHLPVHDLLDRILHEGAVKAAYAQAAPPELVPQIAANIDAFVELALRVEAGRYPSLPRFIDALRRYQTAQGQDAPGEGRAAGADAVRLMTIHGSKGLEARVIVLAGADELRRADPMTWLLGWPTHAAQPAHLSLWRSKDGANGLRARWLDDEKALADREDLNLLYVAITRAKHTLLVSACTKDAGKPGRLSGWDRMAQFSKPQSLTDHPSHQSWLKRQAEFGRDQGQGAASSQRQAGATRTFLTDFCPPLLATGSRQQLDRPQKLAQQLGRALHAWLEANERWPQRDDATLAGWVGDRFDLAPEHVALVRERAHAVRHHPACQPWLDRQAWPEVLVEASWSDGWGRLLRPDRLASGPRGVVLIDYKWSWDWASADDHAAQLDRYLKVALKWSGHPANRAWCLILCSDGQVWRLLPQPVATASAAQQAFDFSDPQDGLSATETITDTDPSASKPACSSVSRWFCLTA